MKYLPAALSLMLLAACVATPAEQQVNVKTDEFSKDVVLLGAVDYTHPYFGGSRDNQLDWWQLRSFINKDSHAIAHDLFMEVTYNSDLKYYNYATDQNAKPLKVISIYRQGGHCSNDKCQRLERISIPIAEADLRTYAHTGYRVKVTAKNGEILILTASDVMMEKQLAADEKYLHGMP